MNNNLSSRSLLFLIVISITTAFVACVTNPDTKVVFTGVFGGHAVFILNEGWFGHPSVASSLDCYEPDANAFHLDVFPATYGKFLGQAGNDLAVNGDMLFILATSSDTIHILNRRTDSLLKSIQLPSGCSGEKMVFVSDSQLAVTSLKRNSVLIVNTNSGKVDHEYPTETDGGPIGIARAGSTLCVCVPGNYLAPKSDMYLIDAGTGVSSHFQAAVNPKIVSVVNDTLAAVICSGDFTPANPGALVLFNPKNGTVVATITVSGNPDHMARDGNWIYVPIGTGVVRIDVTNPAVVEPFVSGITPYSVGVDDVTHAVYISDAKDYTQAGSVSVYDSSKHLLHQFTTGVVPGTMLAVH